MSGTPFPGEIGDFWAFPNSFKVLGKCRLHWRFGKVFEETGLFSIGRPLMGVFVVDYRGDALSIKTFLLKSLWLKHEKLSMRI